MRLFTVNRGFKTYSLNIDWKNKVPAKQTAAETLGENPSKLQTAIKMRIRLHVDWLYQTMKNELKTFKMKYT